MSEYTDTAGSGGTRDAALAGDARAVQHLKDAINNGTNWYTGLLGAIRLWRSPCEVYRGEQYTYLIGGEAFDWLRLAERLTDEVRDRIPEQELVSLLFYDRPPIKISEAEFKAALGPVKYRAYLNYLYGVLTEQALILANIYEVRKKSIVALQPEEESQQAYWRVYRAGPDGMLQAFQKEMKQPQRKSLTLTELKEFTYWLFKYRIKISEKPKVASDTKKALALMYRRMSFLSA